MEVIIAATKTCHHCPILEKELQDMKVSYEVHRVEDHPEMVKKYKLQKSPAIIVDGEVVFYGMPSREDLRNFFKGSSS